MIVPVYNAERYLRETMDCILRQSLENIEVICVDDGSGDRSLELLEEYAAADPRVRILARKNAGAGAARNAGIAEARGRYLSLLDADDRFEPDMLQTAYDRCVRDNADIGVFGCDLFSDESGEVSPAPWAMRTDLLPRKEPFSWKDAPLDIFRLFNGWAWDKLFKTAFVLENGLQFQTLRTTNDMYFVMAALIKADRIITIDQTLAHQRRNRAASISNSRAASWGCFYEALTALRAEIRSMGIYPELERGFVNLALQHSLWQLNTLSGVPFQRLYQKLKEEWFADLGIVGRAEAYFFKPGWFSTYQRIMQADADAYLRVNTAAKKRSRYLLKTFLRHPLRFLHKAFVYTFSCIPNQIRILYKRYKPPC